MWPISASRSPSGGASGRLPRATRRGSVACVEAQLRRLLQPRLGLRHLADLAGQADLAEIHHAGAGRLFGRGRGQRRRHRQIGRRFADPQAAGDVQVDVGRVQPQRRRAFPAPRAASTAARRPSRSPSGAASRRGWATAAPAPPPAPAGCPPGRRTPRCRRCCRAARPGTGRTGLATSARPRSVISNTPISSVAPKRFFTARRMRNWWPRSPSKYSTASTMCSSTRGPAMAPSLVTWPTSTSANCRGLGQPDQLEAGGAHLRHGAGGAVDRVQPHGLDRIDHHQRGVAGRFQAGGDVAQVDRGGEFQRRVVHAQAAGAQAHLLDGFLAGDVEHPPAGAGEAGGGLQQQGGLADAGIAADQHGRGRHQAAAQHAVQFGDAGRAARRRFGAAGQADECDAPAGARPWRRGRGAARWLPRRCCSIRRRPRSGRPISG